MTTDQIYTLLQSGNVEKVKEIFAITVDIDTIKTALKQYNPGQHDVHDVTMRLDKAIYEEGTTLDEDGNKILVYKGSKPVQRIAAPFQKQIVLIRSAFIGTPEMTATTQDNLQVDFVSLISKIWSDNKMDYRFSETKKRTMSELKCAWLFYNVEDQSYWDGQPIKRNIVRPKVKILSYELGDLLQPIYDNNDDMVAFARGFNTKVLDDNLNETEVEHLEIYTAERIYFKSKIKGIWQDNFGDDLLVVTENESTYKPNLIGKIPVIYFAQPAPEWADVQDACNRLDLLFSNHGDTNDYFGNPILFGKSDGGTLSLPQKDDAGKYVEGTGSNTDLKFVTWNNAPESIKMEITNLMNIVFDLSNTANISFENMKGIGVMSGFAINLMFLSSIMKAKDCEMTIFGEGVQRAYNYMKKLISVLDSKYIKTLSIEITPSFTSVLPSNVTETLDNITKAIAGGIMSVESGIDQNPLANNVEIEKERVKAELKVTTTIQKPFVVNQPN